VREIRTNPAGTLYNRWIGEYGPVFRLPHIMGRNQVVVADPLAVGVIFKDIETWYRTSRFVRNLELVMGRNVASTNDVADHTRLRRTLNPAFSGGEIARHQPVLYDAADAAVEQMQAEVDANGGVDTVDVFRYASQAALDIIGRSMFNYDHLGDPANPLGTAIARMLDANINHTPLSMLQVLFPSLTVIPSEFTRTMAANRAIVVDICTQIVEDAKKTGARGEKDDGGGAKDMLSRLVRANTSPEISESQRFSDIEFRDHVSTLIVAGSETTSSTVAFALLRLAQNQAIQKRLRSEIAALPPHPSASSLNALPYLDAVANEALRLYPALPQQDRVAVANTTLPLSKPVHTVDGKVLTHLDIKKGTVVSIPLISINQSTAIWGPDALEFRPERHIPEFEQNTEFPVRLSNPPPYGNVMTFISGRKHCLGYRLAVAELKAVLFTLVRHFHFEEAPGVEIEGRIGFVVRPHVKGDASNVASLPLMVSPVA